MSLELSPYEIPILEPIDLGSLRKLSTPEKLFKLGEAMLYLPHGVIEPVIGLNEQNEKFFQRRMGHAVMDEIDVIVRTIGYDKDRFVPDPYVLLCGVVDNDGNEFHIALYRDRVKHMPDDVPYDVMISDLFTSHYDAITDTAIA